MLHALYKRRHIQSLNTAYENGSWVHPEIDYIHIKDKQIIFRLNDGREITLTAVTNEDIKLVFITSLPVQQQQRPLREVRVTGPDVIIYLHELALIQVQKDGTVFTDIEWELTATDRDLRYGITNRFLLNGKPWRLPIDIHDYNPTWREYDYTTPLDPEEAGEQSEVPTTPS